jgi:hypothetical protein
MTVTAPLPKYAVTREADLRGAKTGVVWATDQIVDLGGGSLHIVSRRHQVDGVFG